MVHNRWTVHGALSGGAKATDSFGVGRLGAFICLTGSTTILLTGSHHFPILVGFSSAASVTSSQYYIYICTYVNKYIYMCVYLHIYIPYTRCCML